MKKKYVVSSKDKKDWITFTQQVGDIGLKDVDLSDQNVEISKARKLDLHGFSLIKANKITKKFIIESFNNGYKKLLIVTGKGSRSQSYNNPYLSEKLSVLKHSIPEYIKNDEDLNYKISRISQADLKDGGEGTICIFLKNKKNFKE